jgi:selenoprotein W-related protein
MAQELPTTFSTDIGEVALICGAGGVFEIRIGEDAVWFRAAAAALRALLSRSLP